MTSMSFVATCGFSGSRAVRNSDIRPCSGTHFFQTGVVHVIVSSFTDLATRLVDAMEQDGLVSAMNGAGNREVLVQATANLGSIACFRQVGDNLAPCVPS
jgi:hypothetical protein